MLEGVPIFMRGSPAWWYPFSFDTRSIATGTMYASSDYLQIHDIPGNKQFNSILYDEGEVHWKATGYWVVKEVSRDQNIHHTE